MKSRETGELHPKTVVIAQISDQINFETHGPADIFGPLLDPPAADRVAPFSFFFLSTEFPFAKLEPCYRELNRNFGFP